MVGSDHRLQVRMRSLCRLPARLAWPHGLFGNWLACNPWAAGFLSVPLSSLFLWHQDYECPGGVLIGNSITYKTSAFRFQRSHPSITLYSEKVSIHLCEQSERAYNSNASGKQPKATEKGKLNIIWTGRHGAPFRESHLGVAWLDYIKSILLLQCRI